MVLQDEVVHAKRLVTLGARRGERQCPLGGVARRLGQRRVGHGASDTGMPAPARAAPRPGQSSNRAPPPARTPQSPGGDSAGRSSSSPATRPRPAGTPRRRASSASASTPARVWRCPRAPRSTPAPLGPQCRPAPGTRQSSRRRTAAPSGSAAHARDARPPAPGSPGPGSSPPGDLFPLDRGGEQVIHAQLPGDLLCGFLVCSVLVGTASGDDREARTWDSFVRRSLATPSAK